MASFTDPRIIGHREWASDPMVLDSETRYATGRKPDPRYRMDWMRERIRAHKMEADDVTPDDRALLDKILSVVQAAYNEAHAAKVGVAALLGAGQQYDIIRAEGDTEVYAVVGDRRLPIPNPVALAAFGGFAAVEDVEPTDPRMSLPISDVQPPAGPPTN